MTKEEMKSLLLKIEEEVINLRQEIKDIRLSLDTIRCGSMGPDTNDYPY